MITFADVQAAIGGVVHKPAYTLYSVCGTGVSWNQGYPFDLGDALEQEGLVTHQPIGYPAQAFPMQPSIDAGTAELKRQILLRDPAEPWAMVGYSQGAIITSNIYDEIRTGDLQAYRASFRGGVTIGNPRRQEGHTIPNGIDPGGHGIVTPNLTDCGEEWWDFADGKAMVNSPGNDLYTTCGAGTDAETVADQEAIWVIVKDGTFTSFGDLAKQVLKIIPKPLSGGMAAVEAALTALDFFVVKGITPHTSYQFVQPIAGDSRDCWRVALDYLASLANKPAPVGASTGAAIPAAAALPQTVKDTLVTAPAPAPVAAPAIDLATIEKDLKDAVNGLLVGLSFVQKFESLLPAQYRATVDTAVKVLTVVNGVL